MAFVPLRQVQPTHEDAPAGAESARMKSHDTPWLGFFGDASLQFFGNPGDSR